MSDNPEDSKDDYSLVDIVIEIAGSENVEVTEIPMPGTLGN